MAAHAAAVNGEVFAAGHAERGNDLPVLLSTSKAERVDGGYRFTGHKFFGSLTPVWTFLGLHGLDTSDPASPKVVHAFMPRATAGYTIKETWDVLGMRATASDDTILDGAFVSRTSTSPAWCPPGSRAPTSSSWPSSLGADGFANVYYGLAQRLVDLTVAGVKKKTSIGISRGSMAHHPAVQHGIAQMAMEVEAIGPHLDRLAEDWTNGVDHGMAWPLKIVAAKHRAVESAWKVADTALELAGGFGIFAASGIERLFRDARLGRIHPASPALAHEIVGKMSLGINPDEQPRWG